MRSLVSLLAWSTALFLFGANIASADGPYPINYNWHNPIDLKAYDPPGPGPGTDGQGDHLVYPGKPVDPSLANDPDAVRWPTVDKSEWEKTKGQYLIKPR